MTPTLEECRSLALTVAPELAIAPLYVVQHAANWPAPSDCGAYAMSRFVDYAVRDALVASGEWKGRGNAIAFVEEPSFPILLHEIAHVLPATVFSEADIEPSEGDRQRQIHNTKQWANAPDPAKTLGFPAWMGGGGDHGPRFIRRAIHLAHRAHHAGYYAHPMDMVVAGDDYELSGIWDYIRALGDEHERLRDLTFCEIEAIPMPAAFVELFRADVQAWLENHADSGLTFPALFKGAA